MNQELMTLDFWQDTVIYEGKTFPVGTLACDALNVPADTITKMNEQCEKINLLLGMLNAGQDTSALFPMAKEAALTMLEILSKTPPFSYMDIPKHRERIERVFTADNALKYVEFAIKAVTNSLPFEEVPKYADAVMLQRYTAVCGHLAYSLEEYQKAMLDFAEQSDGNEADRSGGASGLRRERAFELHRHDRQPHGDLPRGARRHAARRLQRSRIRARRQEALSPRMRRKEGCIHTFRSWTSAGSTAPSSTPAR